MNSCNPALITVGLRLGVEGYYSYFEKFGLKKMTGIDLPGEAGTIMHRKEDMGNVELAAQGVGHTVIDAQPGGVEGQTGHTGGVVHLLPPQIPATLKQWGADMAQVRALRPELVAAAMADVTTGMNPRPVREADVEAILDQIIDVGGLDGAYQAFCLHHTKGFSLHFATSLFMVRGVPQSSGIAAYARFLFTIILKTALHVIPRPHTDVEKILPHME